MHAKFPTCKEIIVDNRPWVQKGNDGVLSLMMRAVPFLYVTAICLFYKSDCFANCFSQPKEWRK